MSARRVVSCTLVALLGVSVAWLVLVTVSVRRHEAAAPRSTTYTTYTAFPSGVPTLVDVDPPPTGWQPTSIWGEYLPLETVTPDPEGPVRLEVGDDLCSAVRSGPVPAGLPGLDWAVVEADGTLVRMADADGSGSFAPPGQRPVTVVVTQFVAGTERRASNEVTVLDPCVD